MGNTMSPRDPDEHAAMRASRTMRMFDAAVGHKFPGVDIDQLYAAYHIATATLKAAGR
jgi:hypothetical protein